MDPFAVPTAAVLDVAVDPTVDFDVLDVREDHEWAAGHIPGARHIPLGDLPARVAELDIAARTLVVCHVGGRSARATAWLVAQGHDATNLAGGMDAWRAAGRPVVS